MENKHQILTQKLLKKKFNKGFLGGYYGTRKASLFYNNEELMSLIKGKPFFDISAGTGQFPFYLAQQGNQVLVNDICYYAGYILKAWGDKDTTKTYEKIEIWLEDYVTKLDPQNIEPVEGYLSSLKLDKIFSIETVKYIDGILTKYPENIIKYAIGNLLVTKFTFRAMSFFKKTDTGKLTIELTPEFCYEKILRSIIKVRRLREKLPNNVNTWANIDDSLDGLTKANIPEDCTVYMDTAWPYKETIPGATPYLFFTETISSILEQREIKANKIWWQHDSVEKIMNDVYKWMDLAFEKGAKQFVVCTQNTNYPDPEKIVYPTLNERYELIKLFKVEDYSNSSGKGYINYWGFYKNK